MSGTIGKQSDTAIASVSQGAISAEDSGSHSDTKEMDRVRSLINQIIDSIIVRAGDDKIDEDRLKEVYKKVTGVLPDTAMRSNKRAAYDRLFGFGEDARKYLPRSKFRTHPLSPIQQDHINCIAATLHHLKICPFAPPYGETPSLWIPFLEHALSKIKRTSLEVVQDGELQTSHDASSREQDEAASGAAAPDDKFESAALSEPTRSTALDAERELSTCSAASAAIVKRRGLDTPELRLMAILATILLLVGIGIFISLRILGHVSREAAPQAEIAATEPITGENPTLPVEGIQIPMFVDPRVLIGPNAGSDQSSLAAFPKVDPRLEEAARLRAEGKNAEADRLTQAVADDWSRARAVSNKNEAEAHRQLGASAFSYRNYDGSIAEYKRAAEIDPTAADFNEIGSAFHAKHDLNSAFSNYSEAIRRAPNKFAWPYNNRGNVYLDRVPPNPDLAINEYNQAIAIDPQLASAFNNRANALQLKGNYEAALLDYAEAIRLNPVFAFAYNGRGNVFYATGKFTEAIANYDKAIEIDPDYIGAWINRGYAYFAAENFPQAIADLSEAITRISKTPDFDNVTAARAYLGRGLAFNMTLRIKEAITDFDDAIRLDPTQAAAYAGRGLSYGSSGKIADALKDFDEALRRDRTSVQTYMVRGGLYLKLGNFGAASRDFAEIVELAPTEPWGYLGRGIARLAQNDVVGGEADLVELEKLSKDTLLSTMAKVFRSAIKGDYDASLDAMTHLIAEAKGKNLHVLLGAYTARGMLYLGRSKFNDAIRDFDDALTINPEEPLLYLARGKTYARMPGSQQKALEDFDRTIKIDSTNAAAYLGRGNIYHERHDYARAIQDYEKVLGLQPRPADLGSAYVNLANISASKGEFAQALDDYAKAIQTKAFPVNTFAHFRRAELFEERGDYRSAINDYDAILKITPMSPDIYRRRARAYRGIGDYESALSDYTALVAINIRDSRAYDDRGDTYYAMSKYDKAIEDYSTAIDQDPKFVYAYFDRGKAYEAKQAYDEADKDYADAIARGPSTTRAVLRQYILHARKAPAIAIKELAENAKKLDGSDRLHPLVELFVGQIKAETVLAGAGDERCEIQFYVAVWHEMQGDKQSAVRGLDDALRVCSKADIPYYDAKIELQRVNQ